MLAAGMNLVCWENSNFIVRMVPKVNIVRAFSASPYANVGDM